MSDLDRNDALRLSIRDRVLRRAGTDAEFRRLLVDNPKSAIARELGIDVPDDVHVTVLPESPSHVFVALPPFSEGQDVPPLVGIERLASVGQSLYAASVVSYGSEPVPRSMINPGAYSGGL